MMWLSINAPYAPYELGDPFSTKCAPGFEGPFDAANCDDPSSSNGAKNPLYQSNGYRYVVDVAPQDSGKPLEVYGYESYLRRVDATGVSYDIVCFHDRAPFNTAPFSDGNAWAPGFTGRNCQTGDIGNTQTQWLVTKSDSSTSPASTGCGLEYNFVMDAGPNRWDRLCTLSTGRHYVWVKSSHLYLRSNPTFLLPDKGNGMNNFALRIAGGTGSKIYALDSASQAVTGPGPVTRTYLADISPAYAGKTIHVDVFNPGTEGGTSVHTLRLKAPPGGSPSLLPSTGTALPMPQITAGCRFNSAPAASPNAPTDSSAADCSVITQLADGTTRYHGQWLHFEIKLDTAYNCGAASGTTPSDCWWLLEHDSGSDLFAPARFVYELSTSP
jgi:hypothetical protein